MSLPDLVKFSHESVTGRIVAHDDGTASVTGIYSKERRKGHANGLMQKIIEYSDEHNVPLYLTVQRYGYKDDIALDNVQLMQFYKKFGFRVVPTGQKILRMRRAPVRSTDG